MRFNWGIRTPLLAMAAAASFLGTDLSVPGVQRVAASPLPPFDSTPLDGIPHIPSDMKAAGKRPTVFTPEDDRLPVECVRAAYDEFESRAGELRAKLEKDSSSFDREYAALKEATVSSKALAAKGCRSEKEPRK